MQTKYFKNLDSDTFPIIMNTFQLINKFHAKNGCYLVLNTKYCIEMWKKKGYYSMSLYKLPSGFFLRVKPNNQKK